MKTEKDFEDLIAVIEDAGKIAYDYFASSRNDNELKRDGSVVTEADKKIEEKILAFIKERFPEDTILGEEGSEQKGTSSFVWQIDPIDGTDNFLRKIPFCAISVARLGDTSEDSFGIVHNPLTKQTFASLKDEGVYENERICNLTAEPLGGRYVISLGRGSGESWMKPAGYALQKGLGMKYGKCFPYGSTALELAYIAANRIDAYLTFGLKSWDYAAGLFLVKSAGAAISVFENDDWKKWEGSIKDLCAEHGKTIFVSHPDIHEDMLETIEDPKSWADK